MAGKKITVIKVRRGIPGKAKYCACSEDGTPIRGFNRLADVRHHWEKEIEWGSVQLVRELDKTPNTRKINAMISALDAILKNERG